MNVVTQIKTINDQVSMAKSSLRQFKSLQEVVFPKPSKEEITILSVVDQALEHLEIASKALFNELD